MADDFGRSVRELELEIDQFTNRIELVLLFTHLYFIFNRFFKLTKNIFTNNNNNNDNFVLTGRRRM